ncbi:MAG: OmpA family protein [Bryobacteraceae bacterium]
MKNQILIVLSVLALGSTVACHKATPVAAKSVPVTPSSSASTPAPKMTANRAAGSTAAAAKSTTSPARGTKMTDEDRMTLTQRLAKLDDALFDYNKATIREDAMTALHGDVDVIKEILSRYPAQKLRIEGYADERGSSEYNLGLGDRRAAATKEFLQTLGIPVGQLTVISFGEERPVCTTSTEECWQKNRRTHITAAE